MTDRTSDSKTGRRAIVLIPGFRREERFFRRDILVRNLLMTERSPLSEVGEVEVAGEQGRRLVTRPLRRDAGAGRSGEAEGKSAASVEIDVFEAFWADMIPESFDRTPWQRLLWGFELVFYWVFSWRSWAAFGTSLYMTFGLLAGGTLLVLWYVSIALLAAEAIGQNPPEFITSIPALESLFTGFVDTAKAIGTWQLWLVMAFCLPLLKIDELVLMAGFIKDYCQNKPDETEVGLRHRLRKRIQITLENVYEADYDEVILLAHSFGTVLAVDLMADWPHSRDLSRTTLVTMGSPAAVLMHRSHWLGREIKRLSERTELATWHDYYADTDWLCTAIPGRKDFAGKGESHRIEFETRFVEKISGQTHLLYYRHGRLLDSLVRMKSI